uniref:C2H2-type domain-containing protein n=1 Tax=Caenorhabditis tropicalis TaxID=1561998 RepID=A0A1I7TPS4_9PELO
MTSATVEVESYVIDQIRCPECSLTCLQKNIYRHMSQMHQWSNDDCKALVSAIRSEKKSRESKASFVCPYCRVLFRSVKHLLQHKRICASQPQLLSGENNDELEDTFTDEVIVEGEEEVVGMENFQLDRESLQEDEVKPSTSDGRNKFDLLVPPHRQNSRQVPAHHLLEDRQQEKSIKFIPPPIQRMGVAVKYNPALTVRHRGTHLTCPACKQPTESLEEFLNHCKDKHETIERKFIVERRLFETREEFKKWFDQRQEDTCTSLTKRTGHGGETLYRCHRVGKYRSVAKSRKSNPRKIDQTCTAYLKVTLDEDGSLWATGCFTHIGHELDHKLLWLTETQENYVRELIDLDWTSDQIYFYIREEYKDYECKLKYISKNDIRNITVRYNREKEKLGFMSDIKPENSKFVNQCIEKAENADGKNDKGSGEEDEVELKMARLETEKFDRASTEDTKVIDEKPMKEDNFKTETPEDEGVEVVEELVEEEEYINVVDDDSMPELEKVDG